MSQFADQMNQNLFQLFRDRFPADGGAPFIFHPDGQQLTYGDLEALTGRMANLLTDLGVKPGDRVASQVEKSAEALCFYLACLRLGAIYLPLNTAYQAGELDYFLGDAEPAVMLCDPARQAEISSITKQSACKILTLDGGGSGSLMNQARGQDSDAPVLTRQADDLAAIVYTSGTTGRSKGAMVTHGNMISNGLTLYKLWGFQPHDILLHALPIFHVHGLFIASHCVLLGGTAMHFLPKFDLDQVLATLPKSTVMMGVPTFYTRLLGDSRFGPEIIKSVRLFISGSAPLLPETFAEFETRTGQRILERYGMSETGMITSNPLDGERIAGDVGFPLPDVQVRVADEDGKVLPAGEVGVLEVKGPNVFKGYWRMPEKTASEFRADGFFITGDLAVISSEGRVQLVGRAKDLVISGGYNVYPKEIELLIDGLEGVEESAVIGLPHKDFGEAVTAVVTLQPGAKLSEADVIGALKGQVAAYKVPKKVIVLDSLPRNAMGKVQKKQLREVYADLYTN